MIGILIAYPILVLAIANLQSQVALAADLQEGKAETVDRSSPKATFETIRNAYGQKKWRVVYESMSDKLRDSSLFEATFICGESNDPKYAAVLKKHNIDTEAMEKGAAAQKPGGRLSDQEAIDGVVKYLRAQRIDEAGFFADICDVGDREWKYGPLTDIVIEGNCAHGLTKVALPGPVVTFPPRPAKPPTYVSETVSFVKSKDGWLLESIVMKDDGPPRAPDRR